MLDPRSHERGYAVAADREIADCGSPSLVTLDETWPRLFNAKAPRREDAKTTGECCFDFGVHPGANGQRFLSPSAPLRLCTFALNLFVLTCACLAADTAKARIWLQQAAAQNDADAKKALDALLK